MPQLSCDLLSGTPESRDRDLGHTCGVCYTKKTKCDGARPCTGCVRHNCETLCAYVAPDPAALREQYRDHRARNGQRLRKRKEASDPPSANNGRNRGVKVREIPTIYRS